MKSFKFIYDISKKYPGLLFINTALSFAVGLLGAFSLFTVTPIIDFLINTDTQSRSVLTNKIVSVIEFFGISVSLTTLCIIFFAFITLGCFLQIVVRFFILKTKYILLKDIITGVFKDFFSARWSFFVHNKQGTLINTLTREMVNIGDAFGGIGTLFSSILELLFFIIVPFMISWQITVTCVILGLFFAAPFILLGKKSYQWGKLNTLTANRLTTVMQENFNLAKLVIGFGAQQRGIDLFSKVYDENVEVTLKSQLLASATPVLYRPFGVVMIIVAVFMGRQLHVPLSELAILLLALLQIAQSIGNIAMYRNSLENFVPSYEQIKDLRELAREHHQPLKDKLYTGFEKTIELKNLSFSYRANEPVLNQINVNIPKRKMVAIVGKSGSGKSTLIDLIMGFYEPQGGGLLVDGVPLQEYNILSYRQRIGYVPQDSVLFNMTIRDNLLWAQNQATQEELNEACRLAYVDEFIDKFPEGYETIVGDRGVRLSGGQIQRVALARAFLRKPDLLILDEATSSLDTHSELLIQQAIENFAKDTTVVVVAHRLSTIKKADCIYILDNGQMIESGSYQDLIAKGGHFKTMAQLQDLEVSLNENEEKSE